MTKKKIVWAPLSSKKFSETVDKSIKSSLALEKKDTKIKLLEHQRIVRAYMSPETPYKGILLYHGLGSGKTCSAISIAEGFKHERKTIVFLPGSLRDNFIHELEKCGNKHYTPQRKHWYFKEYNDGDESFKTIPNKTINDLDGGWFVDNNKSANFSKLSKKEQKKVKEQIKNSIEDQYQIIHYNGVTTETLETFNKDKILDNCLVIVDEAHNIISMMTNHVQNSNKIKSHVRGKLLYQLFRNAENARFLFLSGTPVMNHPLEFSVLFNVLQGAITVFTIKIKCGSSHKINKEYIRQFPYLDFLNIIDESSNSIKFEMTQCPFGFYIKDDVIYRDESSPRNHIEWLDKLKTYIISGGGKIDIMAIKSRKCDCFPCDSLFYDAFVDGTSIKNKDIFMRRIAGMVSYYGDNKNLKENKDSFPNMIYNPIDSLEMTRTQYIQYEKERIKEIRMDAQGKIKKNIFDDEGKETNTYRARSAALCNFVFPSSIDSNINMKDKNHDNVLEELMHKFDIYLDSIKNVEELDLAVKELSPKYKLIKDRLENSKGTSVVYSHLKNREGLNSMFCILKRYGWNELKLNYNEKNKQWSLEGHVTSKSYVLYGTKSDKNREFIRKVFNSEMTDLSDDIKKILPMDNNLNGNIIKAFFITASGAEGITLKNVRNIHVIEHHWSEIRIDQVIGRVDRMNSHIMLPPQERNVNVYKYVTTFGEDLIKFINSVKTHKASFDNIKARDGFKTSDEIVIDVSHRKKQINNKFLDCVKSSSVDCTLHKLIRCYEYDNKSYHPDFDTHIEFSKINDVPDIKLVEFTIPVKKWIPPKFHDKDVLINKQNGYIYDLDSVQIGKPKHIATFIKKDKSFLLQK
tara:strand:+ start:11830 stop:14400 length:2571 start_codon:yes stop_codon:yes gene_type:complete